MKKRILCLCSKGLNRSKYLARYLRGKGYSTKAAGLEENIVTQKQIDWADIIIVVRKRLWPLLKKYDTQGKKIIKIDISDSKRLLPKKYSHLKKLSLHEFQRKWTYPQLRKAIKSKLNKNL